MPGEGFSPGSLRGRFATDWQPFGPAKLPLTFQLSFEITPPFLIPPCKKLKRPRES
jgi:hypothetical protein